MQGKVMLMLKMRSRVHLGGCCCHGLMCLGYLIVAYWHGLHEGEPERLNRGQQSLTQAVIGRQSTCKRGNWTNGSIFKIIMCDVRFCSR